MLAVHYQFSVLRYENKEKKLCFPSEIKHFSHCFGMKEAKNFKRMITHIAINLNGYESRGNLWN